RGGARFGMERLPAIIGFSVLMSGFAPQQEAGETGGKRWVRLAAGSGYVLGRRRPAPARWRSGRSTTMNQTAAAASVPSSHGV
ncbi:MAG: hypothetical protein ACRDV8_03385, partial [Acidimicrobiales bacterium]